MQNQLLKIAFLCTGLVLLAGTMHSQDWKVNSDQWSATDALGRSTLDASDAGPTSNGNYTWKSSYTKLLEVWESISIV